MAYNDRWERQKRYLLRNFLVEPGFQLSPIAEERSSSRSSSCSSLPELVVEPEPNRHDDSEEYYRGLERKMRRYYRQLFLGETGSDDEGSTDFDFDINQSMTSTFILDNENREGNRAYADVKHIRSDKVYINERIFRNLTNNNDDDDMINEYQDVASDAGLKTHEPEMNKENEDRPIEINNQSESTDKSHGDMDITERVINKMTHLSRTKSNSDTEDSIECHIISSTVAQIHERPVRSLRRSAEDLSPVLLPRSIRISRGIAEAEDLMKTSESLGALQVFDEIMEKDSSDNQNEFEAHRATAPKQVPHIEHRRLLTISEVTKVSTESEDSDKLDVDKVEAVATDRNHEDENKSFGQEESDSDNQVEVDKNLQVENKITIRTRQHEETIGPDEFEYSKPVLDLSIEERGNHNLSDWDDCETDDSFEIALRRGVFETKNARKAGIESSDEEMGSSFEDCEPVEEIRAPRCVSLRESFRETVDTEDSPLLTFETQANADKLEDVSTDSDKIDASLNTEGRADEHHTPSLPRSKVLSAIDDIWSVSPVDVNIQELLNKASYQDNCLEPKDSPRCITRSQDVRKYSDVENELAKGVTPSRDNTSKSLEKAFDIDDTENAVLSQGDKSSGDSGEELPNNETQYEEDRSVENEVNNDLESSKSVTHSLSETHTDSEIDNEELTNNNDVDIVLDSKENGDKRRDTNSGIEESAIKVSQALAKRRIHSETEEIPSAKRKRKDMAVQASLTKKTSSDRPMSWNDIKADLFVGTPLVLKLCGCKNHVCSPANRRQ